MTDKPTSSGGGEDSGGGRKEFSYFVDTARYTWPSSSITGAQIRASIPGLNPSYQIIEEGHGGEADKPITDSTTISLLPQHGGEKRFYTAPPATFGA